MPVIVQSGDSKPDIAATLGAGDDPAYVIFHGNGFYDPARSGDSAQTSIDGSADTDFFEIQIDAGNSAQIMVSSGIELSASFYNSSGSLLGTAGNAGGTEATFTLDNATGSATSTVYVTIQGVSDEGVSLAGPFSVSVDEHADVLATASDDSDLIYGDAGADTLFAGGEIDTISGGAGSDLLYGNKGTDLILGQSGNDTIFGGQNGGVEEIGSHGGGPLALRTGSDTLSGGSGDDLIYGNHGDDILSGGAGNDTMFGGQDEDTFVGGGGDDVLYGNFGLDVFQYGIDATTSEGSDTIRGFSTQDDTINTGLASATSTVQSGDDVVVTLSNGTVITLVGVSLDDNPSII
jgi:Ca2+-binding RTX toxin-like protein